MTSNLKKYTFLLLITLSFSGFKGWAQIPMTLYYMENLPQSNMVNPAMMPRANGFVGFPLINEVTSFHSDVAFKDMIQVDANGTPLSLLNEGFDYSKLYSTIGKSANIDVNQQITPLMFGFKTKRGYFTFSMTEKVSMNLGIPKDIFKFTDVGMPENTEYDFSTFNVKTVYYREFSLGYCLELSDKLTVGAHFKPLFGKGAFVTDFNQFKLTSSRTMYSIEAEGNIYSSLPIEVYSQAGEFPDSVRFKDMEMKEAIDKYGKSFSNPGFAVDLGAVYKLNERWSFSAALNNLGYIHWKEDLNSLSFNGNFEFEGVNINTGNYEDEVAIRDEILDSLKSSLNYSSGNEKFSTGLSPVLYAGSSYYVNHAISLGFISRSMFQKYNFRQEFDVSTNINLYRMFTFSFNYNISTKGNNYAGLGLGWYIGPLQFYALADHIPTTLGKYTIDGSKMTLPDNLKSGSFMFGINFIFGSKGFRDKPMIESSN